MEENESDISDDWEFMSKYEAGRQSVSHLSVPKMHEFIEESDLTSYRIGIDSDRGNEQVIFSEHVQESERGKKDEDKQEQLSPHKEMVQTIFFQHDQEKENERLQKEMEAMQESLQCEIENERVRREMVEAMQDLNQNDPEKDRLKRELHEARQTLHQNEQEKDELRRELHEARQTLHQNEQEKDRLRREMVEAKQDLNQNDPEKDRLRREMVEALQDLNQNDPEKDRLKRELHEARKTLHQNEQEKDGLRRELRELKQTLHQKEKEIDRLRRELCEATLDAPQSEQENGRDKRKTDEVMQDNEFTLRSAECSKSQIHATEGESLAKGKDESKIQVISHALSEAFQQFFKINTTQSAKVSTDAAETDKLVKEKYVELTPEQLELFRKAGIEIASSSDEESKE
ncbi:trichohyalin-like [Parasteatoda tepidariorum]|uniref:trichohyalin-like n=1 Tax=Parasteatoda tepidariorum TaxID=114398 RepID=UPI0039BCC4A9